MEHFYVKLDQILTAKSSAAGSSTWRSERASTPIHIPLRGSS